MRRFREMVLEGGVDRLLLTLQGRAWVCPPHNTGIVPLFSANSPIHGLGLLRRLEFAEKNGIR